MTISAPETEAILGSNPPGCGTVVTNDYIFRRFGTVWYQAQMTDTTTTWVVVDNPNPE